MNNTAQQSRLTRRTTYLVVAAIASLISSCATKAQYGEVEGVVKIDGRPAEWVEVVFMPDPAEGTKGKRASCYTDAEGRYRLRTNGEDGGAIIGKHRVVFLDAATVAGPDGTSSEDPTELARPQSAIAVTPVSTAVRRPRIADEYTLPDRTPYKSVKIREGSQTLDFNLRSIANAK